MLFCTSAQLSGAIESKSVTISERGLTSTQWTEYSGGTKRVQYSAAPGSSITAETVTVSGFALSRKDTAGVVTTFTRSYTVNGMVLTQTDGRGNNGECDHMGRRAIKRVMVNGNVTLHQRYIYRGYLQIACIDLTRSHHPALWYITWDPTQPIATRPLAIQKDGTWYTYGWDLTKNICEVYRTSGTLGTSYTYTPYGQVSAEGATEQPIQWSSEFNDTELGLIYYNYRHYNPVDGRWTGRDCLNIPTIPAYIYYNPLFTLDYVGNLTMSARSYGASIERRQLYDIEWDMALDFPAKNRLYIVQKIIKDISVIWCYSTHDSMKSSRERYWEAWLVYKKEIKPRVPKGQVIDRWYHDLPKIKSSKGEVVMTSEAKVFPRSVTGDLGDQMKNTGNYPGADSRLSEWKPAEYNKMSGGISSTNNQPRWWNSPSLEETTKQKVEITWDYCECKYDYEMKINGEVVIHNLIS